MNVLFIGNSYTSRNDLEKIFQALCRENGKDVHAFRVTQGGRRMIQYENNADPITQQLKETLEERYYDAVFLQEQSLLPLLEFDMFLEGIQYVNQLVREKCEKVFLYATWARKAGSPDLLTYRWTPETMTRDLDVAYRKVAVAVDAVVSPVGKNFYTAVNLARDIDLYDLDLYHPSYFGSCLAALTHYYTLFGEFPDNMQSLSLEESVQSIFRAAVCQL